MKLLILAILLPLAALADPTPEEIAASRKSNPMTTETDPKPQEARSPASAGSALLRRLQNHQAAMSPEQKERLAGKLLLDATTEIQRLIGICEHVHDRLLRGDDDTTLMRELMEGWQGPSGKLCNSTKAARPDGPGDAPPMSCEADGWWWYWDGNEWCPASVTFHPANMIEHANWWVTFIQRDGGRNGFRMRDRNDADWGGRLDVPGASPNVRISDGANVE